MKIKREFLSISSGARAEDGSKLEPEQQPITRVMETLAAATGTNGRALGALPVEIHAHATAQELSAAKGRQCYGCRWWGHEAWQHTVADAEGPLGSAEDRKTINDVRAAILGSGNASVSAHYEDHEEGGPDVERALRAMGICHALTEHERKADPNMGPHEWVVTFPTACCPMTVVSPTQPFGYFKPRDSEMARAEEANRDAVLLRAAGKIA